MSSITPSYTKEEIRNARLQGFALPSERPTAAAIAQQILSSTGRVIAEADIAGAMAGRVTSAAAAAAVPQALRALGQVAVPLPSASNIGEKRPRDEKDTVPKSSQEDPLENSKRVRLEGGQLAAEEVSLNPGEGDAHSSDLNRSVQIAAQAGRLDVLASLIESGEELSKGTLHHAFILAARHGHRDIVDCLFATYEIPEDWICYTIIEALERKHGNLQPYLDHEPGQPPLNVISIEEPDDIKGCLSNKQSIAMIKHLLSLSELSEESLDGIVSYVCGTGNRRIFRHLSDSGKMSLEQREKAIKYAREFDNHAVLEECVSYNLSSREEELWALEFSALYGGFGNCLNILKQWLNTGRFSLEDRETVCLHNDLPPNEEFFHPALLALLTEGLSDQDRFWAVDFAIGKVWDYADKGEGEIVGVLLKHYSTEDAAKGTGVANHGFSDDELVGFLAKRHSHTRVVIKHLVKYCTISNEMLESATKQVLKNPEASYPQGLVREVLYERLLIAHDIAPDYDEEVEFEDEAVNES